MAKITPPDWVEENPTHPILGPGPGPYRARLLSDPGRITQFGAFFEELPPARARPATRALTPTRP